MRIILGIILGTVLVYGFYIYYVKNNDMFHPLAFFCIMQFMRYVPMMFNAARDTNDITEDGIIIFFIMEIITIMCVFLGFRFGTISHICIGKRKVHSIVHYEGNYNNRLNIYGWVFFAIGAISRIYFISRVGGMNYILANIRAKVTLTSGYGYLLSFGYFMTFGICFLISYYSDRGKMQANIKFILIILSLINCFLLGFMSDRAPVLISLMMIFMTINYKIKRIKIRSIFTPKYLALIFAGMLFVVAMPLLRNAEGFYKYGSWKSLLDAAGDNLSSIFVWFSYLGRDSFIFQHYNLSNFWYGANYINLLFAFLPRSIFGWKPPVDEGIYLVNAINGNDIMPPSTDYPINNSFPFSNQGICFTNYGIIGLVFGSLLLGYIYAKMYKTLKSTKYNVIAIIFSQLIIYKFTLTSHDIAGILSLVIYLIVPLFIFGGFRIRHHNDDTEP